jgi:hypothetical protein
MATVNYASFCNERQPQVTRTEQNSSSQSGLTVCHTSKGKPSSQILLATAIVYVRDKCGQLVKRRALLNSASQSHFVTKHLVQQLHLRKFKAQIHVQGINEVKNNSLCSFTRDKIQVQQLEN